MALTLRNQPASFLHPAFNAVEYGVETNRTSVVIKSVSSLANNGGYLEITTSAAHGLINNDVVELAGFTNTPQDRTKIAVISTTKIKCTDIPYSASITQSGGTVTRTNDNFKVRCYVKVGTPVIGQMYINYTETVGLYTVYNFDVSGILQDYILNQNEGADFTDHSSTGAVSPSAAYTGTNYTLYFVEIYDNAFGIPMVADDLTVTTVGGTAMRAVNFGMQPGETFSNYVCTIASPGKMLTRATSVMLRPTETLTIQVLTSQGDAGLRYTRYFTDGTPAAQTNSSLVTVANNRVFLTILGSLITSTIDYIKVEAISTANALITSTPVYIYPDRTAVRQTLRLRWKNLLGGVDQLYFPDNLDEITAQAYEYESTAGIKTYEVDHDLMLTMTRRVTNEEALMCRDLFVSKVTYLNAERVNLTDRRFEYQTRDYRDLTVTVKRQKLILN